MGLRQSAMSTTGMREAASTRTLEGRGPGAVRQQAARFVDARLVGGVVLICVSVAAGVLLLGRGPDTVTVWRASRDLAAGSQVVDAEPVALPRSSVSDRYVSADQEPAGVLTRPVASGELLPISALAAGPPVSTRRVTVPVDPLHAPPGLQAGETVDVWSSLDAQSPQPPTLVLADVVVAGVSAEDSGLSGQVGVVLAVPEAQVAAVVAASRGGVLDLVAVPLDAQGSAA